MKSNSLIIPSVIIMVMFLAFAGEITASPDPASSPSGQYFPSDNYNPSIPKPSEYLGYPLGSKPASHAEISGYLRLLSDSSPRAKLTVYGKTYEGRELYILLVSSESNMARIDEIKTTIGKIADPRKMEPGENIDKIISGLPAIAWAGYSVHGDELSSSDAALAVAYQLVAGADDGTKKILDNLVVLIDPLQNPDGRERFLAQVRSFSSEVSNTDLQGINHTGVWPWGRGNHYLIDLNRDNFTLVYPETRGKVGVWVEWHPQLMIDSHEMGALSNYLFSPPRAPFNPRWPGDIRKWWDRFASAQAKAFDRYSWSYFTRDWNEEWFPGYSSSWGIFLGAVGILYEQAGVDGAQVKQSTGKILTYSETVHHHLISTISNLTTAAGSKDELLKSYYDVHRSAIANKENSLGRAMIIDRFQNPGRVDLFVETLRRQGIEIRKADKEFSASGLRNERGVAPARRFPAGSYIIDFPQPSRYLLQVLVDYDIRMPNGFLAEQRRYLEKGWGTRMYDVSAWSLPLAFGLETYISGDKIDVSSSAVAKIEKSAGGIAGDDPLYGFMVDNSDDAVMNLLAEALDKDLKVRITGKPLKIENLSFKRGSLLFIKKENPDSLKALLAKFSDKYGLKVYGINTALASDGPDLGGEELNLLVKPKIAILTGSSVSTSSFGAYWHLFDRQMGIRVTPINIDRMGYVDLSLYNVLIFPSPWAGTYMLKSILGDGGISRLRGWVEDGGTLVVMESAAEFCADSTVNISDVRLRNQVLNKLDEYEYAVMREVSSDNVIIDSLKIWESKEPPKEKTKEENAQKPGQEELARQDEFAQKFSPDGVIFDCKIDTTQWLSYGLGESLPVILFGSSVYLTKPPVSTVARLKGEKELRLSGLTWPETRARWANSAYCTRESKGRGQVILFASDPFLRSYFHGSNRLLLNAVLLGPGLGTHQPLPY